MKKSMLQENLYRALGLFIEAMRPYVIAKLKLKAGDKWHEYYVASLTDAQKEQWNRALKQGSSPESLIDFNNLKGFALRYKDLLRDDFEKKVTRLPTWFEDIADVRNKCQHYQNLENDEIERAFNTMVIIVRYLHMEEMEKAIAALKEDKEEKKTVIVKKKKEARNQEGIIPWFVNVSPHMDIRQGHLDESIFAANLTEVVSGNGREIYQNPAVFFSKTYVTMGLKTVARRVIKGLNGSEEAENRVISLQTGFGGGKTHVLISLYHIARLGKKASDISYTGYLTSYTGNAEFDTAHIAVFTNKTNDTIQGRHVGGLHIRTMWGEIAYQLGGIDAYNLIRENDEKQTAPKGLFKQMLEKVRPALILIDELADYCSTAAAVTVGSSNLSDQTISFIQELTEAVAAADKCVLVATLPASAIEVGNTPEAAKILNSLMNRLARVGADTKPVADEEIFEVIRRRLFEDLGDKEEIEKVISAYTELYRNIEIDIPSHALRTEYRNKMLGSYPFHPELIDMFRIRWASHHDFQRTRGVLRILASIAADLWQRQGSLKGTNGLIQTSDVNFENLDALTGQLKKLYGNGYDAVISADVSGSSSNAFHIDSDKKEYGTWSLTQGIASTILLGSFGSTGAHKGIGVNEIKLCVLKPHSFNHNSVNGALDALEGSAHYLYYSSAGAANRRYWFHTKPNINILINQAQGGIKKEKMDSEIIQRIANKVNNVNIFNVLVAPSGEIPEQNKPALIILGPEYTANHQEIHKKTATLIKQIATKRGNSERIYRNTLLFLVSSEIGIAKCYEDLRNYCACIQIRDEYRSQLEADQKDDIRKKIETYSQHIDNSIVTAYSVIAKYSAKAGVQLLYVKQFKGTIDIQINTSIYQLLKDTEEWILEAVGLNTLRTNNLLPEADRPVRVKDVYEAFIRYDDKPMITGIDAVQRSLLKYCYTGEFGIAAGDGETFEKIYYKETVHFFDVTDSIYWLVHKSKAEENRTSEAGQDGKEGYEAVAVKEGDREDVKEKPGEEYREKVFKRIVISGKVDVANYSQIFTSFIMPLQTNGVEVEVKITGKSNKAKPITETSEQYKITKESAKQLGLDFEVEE